MEDAIFRMRLSIDKLINNLRYLTLYIITVCILSILISKDFPKVLTGRICLIIKSILTW